MFSHYQGIFSRFLKLICIINIESFISYLNFFLWHHFLPMITLIMVLIIKMITGPHGMIFFQVYHLGFYSLTFLEILQLFTICGALINVLYIIS